MRILTLLLIGLLSGCAGTGHVCNDGIRAGAFDGCESGVDWSASYGQADQLEMIAITTQQETLKNGWKCRHHSILVARELEAIGVDYEVIVYDSSEETTHSVVKVGDKTFDVNTNYPYSWAENYAGRVVNPRSLGHAPSKQLDLIWGDFDAPPAYMTY